MVYVVLLRYIEVGRNPKDQKLKSEGPPALETQKILSDAVFVRAARLALTNTASMPSLPSRGAPCAGNTKNNRNRVTVVFNYGMASPIQGDVHGRQRRQRSDVLEQAGPHVASGRSRITNPSVVHWPPGCVSEPNAPRHRLAVPIQHVQARMARPAQAEVDLQPTCHTSVTAPWRRNPQPAIADVGP